ncbi:hypothetical protein [Lentzea cavernae]|uniref:hypothetical protein n=1 Tax=Lentzea cavernae TaxID=2020703 RepID=UPI001747E350|nr:hypothetical protein [Lentzea cavernae]
MAVVVRKVLVGKFAQRGHQAGDLSAHDRQSGLGVAVDGDLLQQSQVGLEALTQFVEQDVVAHR